MPRTERFSASIKPPIPAYLERWAETAGIALSEDPGAVYVLEYRDDRLLLNWRGQENFRPVSADVPVPGRGGARSLLVRAMGKRKGGVADLTAGFGIDAFTLAANGWKVYCVERNPAMALLLCDALARAPSPITARVSLVFSDSRQWLRKLPRDVNVLFMDVMFQDRKKSVMPRKSMQILRRIAGDDEDSDELFQAAMHCPVQRVVVKTADDGPATGYPLLASYSGKTVRFDTYRP